MAESEKPGSSPGKGKAKSSFLDEDMSKDFLRSWKSMSVTGGSDMDFNFEPVTKGNKKAFDFGMDMDFSLDDAFGKMPSFNLDMPDIDFSSSPKKSSKSKDKEPEEAAAKGNQQKKNDKFTFSFDFNGFDDFNLDKPSTKSENNATGDKNKKQASSSPKVQSGDLPRQAANSIKERREDATYKELPTPKVAVNSEPCFSVEQETSLDASSCKSPSNTTIAIGQQKGTQNTMDIECDVDALERGPDSSMTMETSLKTSSTQAREHDFSSNSQSNLSDMLVGSEEAYVSPVTNRIMTAEGIEEGTHSTEKTSKQVFSEVGEHVQSTAVPMIEVSAQAISSYEEVCSPNRKLDHESETETLREEIAAAALLTKDSKTLNSDRSSPPRLTENVNISEEGKMVGVVERRGNGHSTSDTGTCSKNSIAKTMNDEVSLNAELQRSGLKDPPARSESESTPARSMLKRYKLSGVNNFSMARSTNDGAGSKLVTLDRSKKGSTPLKAAGSSEGNGGKLDDNPGSFAKELIKQDLSVEKKEKNADVLRDSYSKENREIQTKMVFDAVRHEGQAKKDGFRLLDNRKMGIDVKPSGVQLPSHVTADREAKSSNQGCGELKDKIFSIETVQKLNGGQVTRLSSARVDKIMPSLPSLRMSRNVTANKQSSSSIVQDTKTVGNYGKVARLHVKSKMVSPVNVQKQTPPIPSLKRKPTEDADLHPSKRLSPNEKSFRMPKVSARDVENEVRTQGTVSEGSKKDVTAENLSPKFDFHLEANMENLGFTLMAEGDANVEKAEACAKELDDICSMLKKKHDEAKELLVRALVNNNNLLMLNHPICEEKIRQVQKFASRLMSREQEAGV